MWHIFASTAAGALLIAIALRDMMHELFHPEATGSSRATISRAVMHWTWQGIRAIGKVHRPLIHRAGPIILVAVALAWTGMLVLGWALIYWPRLPGAFLPDPGLPMHARGGFFTALYISLASLTTLSASDLTPRAAGMRVLVPLEAMVGPVLYTAWITWVLSIYPVLADRRAFAREIGLLRRAEPDPVRAVREPPADAIAQMLRSLTEQVLKMSTQIKQSRVTYYFQNESREANLLEEFPYALALARAAEAHGTAPAVRHHGTMLRLVVEEMLSDLGDQYLGRRGGAPGEIIDALRRDHLFGDGGGR